MTDTADGVAETPVRRFPWGRALGTTFGVAIIGYLISEHSSEQMLRTVRATDLAVLALSLPLVLLDMMLRGARWRVLLGDRGQTSYLTVFSSLMMGYLANLVLPARAGDLVRVYVLGNEGRLSRSWILGTVFVERVLDMAAVIVVLALVVSVSTLPPWLQRGGLMLTLGTLAGVFGLGVVAYSGETVTAALLRPLQRRRPELAARLRQWSAEFSRAAARLRVPSVLLAFVIMTAMVWALEVLIVFCVAQSLGISLSGLEGAVLMLFSLFSSLIPALPGQLGTFELAMVSGLEFLGLDGPAALPFALALHLVLLGGTSLIGLGCLVLSGAPLLPRPLMRALEQRQ